MIKNLDIKCHGISDITPRVYDMEVSLEDCYLDFIKDIDAKQLVLNCADPVELLDAIDEYDIHSWLESNGYIFNKA